MDSRTDFDDDERFFGSYDAERAVVEGASEVDATGPEPPTPAQLAHLNRFRRPVAWVVAGLALFSLLALEERGARREFVASYYAAVPASVQPAAPPSIAPERAASEGSVAPEEESLAATTRLEEISIQADAPPDAIPECESAGRFVSELTAMCLGGTSDNAAPRAEKRSRDSAIPTRPDSCAELRAGPVANAASPFEDLLETIGAVLTDERR